MGEEFALSRYGVWRVINGFNLVEDEDNGTFFCQIVSSWNVDKLRLIV